MTDMGWHETSAYTRIFMLHNKLKILNRSGEETKLDTTRARSAPHDRAACVYMRLSMEEALVAATLNAAYSLGRGRTHGAISVGRQADFVVLDGSVSSWKHIIYRVSCAAASMNIEIFSRISSFETICEDYGGGCRQIAAQSGSDVACVE
ncbi:hypothetical protein TELCIR_07814 [Teladorsagia circumcincta]|uniref:Probable imidazolonepropionase n=1 Tax=Teladorsagia circumcincta TaxID=45464 RepID=A0A2G9UJB2_TELCI|nr:hypothetical protein TELCIR_07814 [Teladorsagia circumcincta]